MADNVPETPAGIDAHVDTLRASYRDGYRDGCEDMAARLGYTVEYDEAETHFRVGTMIGLVFLTVATVIVFGLVLGSENFPRERVN